MLWDVGVCGVLVGDEMNCEFELMCGCVVVVV